MFNTEFFKLGNFITLSIIILIWLVIHDRWIKRPIDGAQA
jgi:hypothetical protein